MTRKPSLRRLIAPWLSAFLMLALTGWAHADPPSRVARLAYVSGAASFSPGGERDWGRAVVNRPLIAGDRLWVDRGARAELQLGVAAIRVGGATSITLLNLDDRIAQVQLAQGTLNIRVRRLDRGQVFEVDTPNLAFSIRRPGNYRIQVDPDGDATTVTVRSGLAEVHGEGRAFIAAERRSYRFYGSGLRDFETVALLPVDEFDRWASQRDRRWDNSASRRYVSTELIGYEDLDQYGTWRKVPDHGFVWVPTRVPADWAPYRDGHWAWVEPWGWTWVDEAPWGFAPSHYGRWAYVDRTWAWVPGPANVRPVYAPALVAFVGGSGVQAAGGGGNGTVAWFPLGPRDVYRPSYPVSREYFANVNTSNTVVNRAVVVNAYGTPGASNATYANQQIAGAVVAVLASVISQSRPVARETVRMSPEVAMRAPTVAVAPVAPVHASVVGPTAASVKPPENVQSRPVVAQTAPPPPPVPFAARQSALAANAGKPLDAAAVAALKPAASAPAPAVKVVQPSQPVALPAGARPAASAPSAATAPAAAARPAVPAPAAASAPVPAPPTPAAPSAPASRPMPAAPPTPAAAPPAPAKAAAPPAAATPPAPPLAPAAPPAAAPVPSDSRTPPAREARPRGRDAREGAAAPEERRPAAAPPTSRAQERSPATPPALPAEATPPSRPVPAASAAAPPPRAAAPAVAAPPPAPPAPPRAAASAPVPAAAAKAASAAPPATPAPAASAEQRGPRGRPGEARAPGRREAASEATPGDRRGKREEEEQRKP